MSAMVEVDGDMAGSPFADWLSTGLLGSSPSEVEPPSTPPHTEGWLLERENRENRISPMPFPILAAPGDTGGRGGEEGEEERGRG